MNSARLKLPRVLPAWGRVRLRRYEERDAEMVMNVSTDPYLSKITSLPAEADHGQALAFIGHMQDRLKTGSGYALCVADAKTDLAVGGVALWLHSLTAGRATIGYWIAPEHRGNRFASDALRAITAFAWSIPELHRIELYIEPWNTASALTAQAAGYDREGLLRSHVEIGGQRVDMLIYATVR